MCIFNAHKEFSSVDPVAPPLPPAGWATVLVMVGGGGGKVAEKRICEFLTMRFAAANLTFDSNIGRPQRAPKTAALPHHQPHRVLPVAAHGNTHPTCRVNFISLYGVPGIFPGIQWEESFQEEEFSR